MRDAGQRPCRALAGLRPGSCTRSFVIRAPLSGAPRGPRAVAMAVARRQPRARAHCLAQHYTPDPTARETPLHLRRHSIRGLRSSVAPRTASAVRLQRLRQVGCVRRANFGEITHGGSTGGAEQGRKAPARGTTAPTPPRSLCPAVPGPDPGWPGSAAGAGTRPAGRVSFGVHVSGGWRICTGYRGTARARARAGRAPARTRLHTLPRKRVRARPQTSHVRRGTIADANKDTAYDGVHVKSRLCKSGQGHRSPFSPAAAMYDVASPRRVARPSHFHQVARLTHSLQGLSVPCGQGTGPV